MRSAVAALVPFIFAILLRHYGTYVTRRVAEGLAVIFASILAYLVVTSPTVAGHVLGEFGMVHRTALIVVAAVFGAAIYGGGMFLILNQYEREGKISVLEEAKGDLRLVASPRLRQLT